MDQQWTQIERRGGIAILTIQRPEALNALNVKVLKEIEQQLSLLEDVGALILTGAGDKAFIAGADIKAMVAMTPSEMHTFCEIGQRVSLLLERAPFVTIAAVNGFALGGGLEIALACDFIYANAGARLGLPEVSLGLIPGFGGTQRLLRAVGTRRAKELIATGEMFTAEEGMRIGVVNKICGESSVVDAAVETAKKILSHSFQAVVHAKEAINHGEKLSMNDGLELEKALCALAFAHPDRMEGMTAFIEKRKPCYTEGKR